MQTRFSTLGSYTVGSPGIGWAGLGGELGLLLLIGLVLLLLYGASLYGRRGGSLKDGLAAGYLGLAALVGAAITLAGAALMIQSLLLYVAPVPAAPPCVSPLAQGAQPSLLPGPGTTSPGQPVVIPGNRGCAGFSGYRPFPQDSNPPNMDPGPPLARGLGLFAAGLIFMLAHALIWRARPRLQSAQPVRSQLGGIALVGSGLATLGALLMTAGGLISAAIFEPHISPGTYHAIGVLIVFGPAFGYLLVRAFPAGTVKPAPPRPEAPPPSPSEPPAPRQTRKPKPRSAPRAAARKRSTPSG